MEPIEKLARAFPWPESQPAMSGMPKVEGWMLDGPRELLSAELSRSTRVVIELGTWLGLSTRFILSHAPNAVVIAIDHWKGSPEHHLNPEWSAILPTLFETFQALCWNQRERIVPIRKSTCDGLRTVASYGVYPDVVYVDAEHSYDAVRSEIALCRELFPNAILIGDDYSWEGVTRAVTEAERKYALALETAGKAWRGWRLHSERAATATGAVPIAVSSADRLEDTNENVGDVACLKPGEARSFTKDKDRKCITFLDPCPESGLYPFARILEELRTRCPEIPILIVETGALATSFFECGIDITRHRNVKVIPASADRQLVWGMTRIAVMPWLKADVSPVFALEALSNGVPILGSIQGPLPELVGRSGVLLSLPPRVVVEHRVLPSPDEMRHWVDAILQLWRDDSFYHEQSQTTKAECERLYQPARDSRRIDCPRDLNGVRKRSVVLVPHLNGITAECERSLCQLEVAGVRVVRRSGSSAIDVTRSEMASDALHDGAERILFVDADIGFDAADALRLLARSEPVVAGVYAKKNVRELACTFADGITHVVFGAGAPAPYPLKYAGAGFLRIRAEVLHRMIRELSLPPCNTRWCRGLWPFFYPVIVPDEGGLHYLAEDWAFSHRLRQIGIAPLGDTSIRLWHMGWYGFGWEDAGAEAPRYRTYGYHLTGADAMA